MVRVLDRFTGCLQGTLTITPMQLGKEMLHVRMRRVLEGFGVIEVPKSPSVYTPLLFAPLTLSIAFDAADSHAENGVHARGPLSDSET